MRALGIDFGTSNTVAVVAVDATPPHPLLFDGSPMLPSAVYLDPAGRLVAGRDAERAARLDPSRFEPNPKRRVDEGAVFLGDREVPVPQLVAAVLARVGEEAHRWVGDAFDLVLTHPAGWSSPRRAVLIDAARLAGLPVPRLVPEPVAAASYFTTVLRASVPPGAALAVYDLGGGTFDAAVVRRSPATGGFEVLSSQGLADLGGLDFDQALVDHLGRGYSTSRTTLWKGLVSPEDAAQRRQRALLYDDVRGAKETLSRGASADVHLPALDVAAHVTRDELEELVRPMVARTVECLVRTIGDARLGDDDLVGVFLVGGSSRIPLVARMIHHELGIAPTALEQPETVVAQGAVSDDRGTPSVSAPPSSPAPGYPSAYQPPPGPQGYPGTAPRGPLPPVQQRPVHQPPVPQPSGPQPSGPQLSGPQLSGPQAPVQRPASGPPVPVSGYPASPGPAYPMSSGGGFGPGSPAPTHPGAGAQPGRPAAGYTYPGGAGSGYPVSPQTPQPWPATTAATATAGGGRSGFGWMVTLIVLDVIAAIVLVVLLATG